MVEPAERDRRRRCCCAGAVPGDGTTAVVISGGNVDPLLLTRLIDHGLSAAGRYLLLRVVVEDRPGALARLTAAVAAMDLNVLAVDHHRSGTTVGIAEVEVLMTVETRDPDHRDEVVARLVAGGFDASIRTWGSTRAALSAAADPPRLTISESRRRCASGMRRRSGILQPVDDLPPFVAGDLRPQHGDEVGVGLALFHQPSQLDGELRDVLEMPHVRECGVLGVAVPSDRLVEQFELPPGERHADHFPSLSRLSELAGHTRSCSRVAKKSGKVFSTQAGSSISIPGTTRPKIANAIAMR